MKIRIISLLTIFILILNVLFPFASVFANEKNSSEVIKGTYKYVSNADNKVQSQNTFEYRDDCFTRSSYLGCKHLEVLSIQIASTSVSYYEEDDKYETDPSQNAKNVIEMLDKIHFVDIKTNDYYTTEKHENSIGVAVGHKNIVEDGKTYTLLGIFPRGAGYKEEWAGNFTIGDGDIHEGFKQSRDEILRFVKKYVQENNIKGDLKIWTAGWSRGAAISNMIAGFFAGGGIEYLGENVDVIPENVYCYTIATPKTIKNGLDKNIELSVSGNRTEPEYTNDTPGESFQYTKGGSVNSNDDIYGGIRSVISPDDIFPLLPLEKWGYTYYGKVIDLNQSLNSEKDMLEELKSINNSLYNEYTNNGEIKEFKNKTFDLKTLSIVDSSGTSSPTKFLKERFKGLGGIADTSKEYKDGHYQDALKSLTGLIGMLSVVFKDSSVTSDIETSKIIEALVYTYLAYASEELQKEGKAENEKEGLAITIEELLSYFSGEEIKNNEFTVDDLIRVIAKYLSDNENEPVGNAAISGIMNLVPENYKWFLDAFKGFAGSEEEQEEVTTEDGLRAFIKACYYGADPNCSYAEDYSDPVDARKLLCMTLIFAIGSDMPELQEIFIDETGSLNGKNAKFEDFIGIILNKFKTVKDEDGNVIKTYSNLSEIADDKIIFLLDNYLEKAIEKSGELYGEEFKEELEKQRETLKQNITEARVILSSLFFYTDNGLNTGEIIGNITTFIDNIMLIPINHYNEIYLAYSRNSNRYEDHSPEEEKDDEETDIYKCIEGDGQIFDKNNDENLTFKFNFDYDVFIEEGIVFINNNEVSKDNYLVTKGSTVITFNKDYVETLSEGEYELKAALISGGEAEAKFTISEGTAKDKGKIDLPKTGDNISIWLVIMAVSVVGYLATFGYLRKYLGKNY